MPRLLGMLSRRPYLVLGLLGLMLWLPGVLSLPPLDRDESRFAQSSRQMVESGDPVDIRFGQVPRYKKPAGIYWLQSAATAALGMGRDDRIWTYRLPSLLGAIAASWLTVWCALAFVGAEIALVAGLLLLSTVLLTAEATIATTDAVLLACTVAVQSVLLRVYCAARDDSASQPSTKMVLWGWAALAAGILVKGPVIVGVAAATIIALLAWDRRAAWLKALRPIRGLLLTLVLVSPWLLAISIQSHGAFLQQSLGNDFAAKMAGGQESHGALPGYYLLLSAAAFFPAILFVAPGVVLGIARRGDAAVRFLLCWAGSWWLVVEIVPTKLPHYVISAYPALAILAALFVMTPPPEVRWLPSWLTVTRWIAGLQFVIGAALLTTVPILLPGLYGEGRILWLIAPAAVGAVLSLAALILVILRRHGAAVLAAVTAMLVFVPTLTTGVAPRLDRLWISEKVKAAVRHYSQPGDPPPALAGYQEPSLVFDLGKDVKLVSGAGAADAVANDGGLALVENAELGNFLARLAERQADGTRLAEITGFNYSRGRPVEIGLYRVHPVRDNAP